MTTQNPRRKHHLSYFAVCDPAADPGLRLHELLDELLVSSGIGAFAKSRISALRCAKRFGFLPAEKISEAKRPSQYFQVFISSSAARARLGAPLWKQALIRPRTGQT